MKKLTKIMALGLVLSMSFGMTAFAAQSPTVSNGGTTQEALKDAAEAADVPEQKVESAKGEIVIEGTVSAVTVTVCNEAEEKAANEKLLNANNSSAGQVTLAPVKVFVPVDLDVKAIFADTKEEANLEELGGVSVTVTIPGVQKGHKYVMLHKNSVTNKWENLKVEKVETDKITAKFTNFSPIIVVEVKEVANADDAEEDDAPAVAPSVAPEAPVAPKTGETLPVAGVLAVVTLAGLAVCAKKMRRI